MHIQVCLKFWICSSLFRSLFFVGGGEEEVIYRLSYGSDCLDQEDPLYFDIVRYEKTSGVHSEALHFLIDVFLPQRLVTLTGLLIKRRTITNIIMKQKTHALQHVYSAHDAQTSARDLSKHLLDARRSRHETHENRKARTKQTNKENWTDKQEQTKEQDHRTTNNK